MWRVRSITGVAAGLAIAAMVATGAGAVDYPFTTVQRGKYLVDAGDCIACHTVDPGKPFAGGRGIETPFGTIFSANITPDRETGIGAWTEDDFYRAMHEGRGPHGERLYPAFPYPYFTRMTRDDVNAVRTYLMSLAPIHNSPPANQLFFPLNFRSLMIGWNTLFFSPGEFVADANKSAEWNRGAYLVQGPGHCGACHTPKNMFGADKTSQLLQGAQIQDWTAPNLVADSRQGLGAWSVDDIAEFLKTGRNRFSGATGLMAEVVVNSTSKLDEADLKAIATYLKDLPAAPPQTAAKPSAPVMAAGEAIYTDSCAACHQTSGEGVPRMFPPLKGDAVAQQTDASTALRVILEGALTAPTASRPTPSAMPAFDWKLSDAQVAAVATYVRNAWGNNAPAVQAADVAAMRKAISADRAEPATVGSGVRMNEQSPR